MPDLLCTPDFKGDHIHTLTLRKGDLPLRKLYIGISLLLLLSVMCVGLGAVIINGVPEIGIRSFVKGEYASKFHKSLVDEFSGEELLSTWNQRLNQLYSFTGFSGKENVQILVPIINDGADHGAHIPEMDMPTPPTEDEKEELTTIPPTEKPEEPTSPPFESTEPSETESLPEEEEPAAEALGQILLMGNRAMELPVTDYDAIGQYSDSVSAIGEALEDVEVYSVIVPNSAGLYAPKDYREGEDSQENMIDYAYSTMAEGIHKVDAYSVLEEHKEEYIYFRTDHHWTHLGSYYAYTAFCETAGFDSRPLRLYDSGTYETFLGTMYSFLSGYPQRDILREDPDYLTYYIPYRETTVRYYDSGDLYYGGKIDMVYPLSEDYSNKYICFLGGDHPITVIETDQEEERVCLLIKESYGNAFATWLTGHYSKIICIDPREFNRNGKPGLDLKKFVENQGVDDCIILNYPLMINSSAYSAWLGRLVP